MEASAHIAAADAFVFDFAIIIGKKECLLQQADMIVKTELFWQKRHKRSITKDDISINISCE